MKRILFAMVCMVSIMTSCTKEEEPKLPIDSFVGTHTGNLKTVTCEDGVLIDTKTGITAKITKDNDTDVTGVLSENGSTLFSFSAKLDESNNNLIKISEFAYGDSSYFGKGEVSGNNLELQFASRACPKENNTFGVTLIFK